MSLLTVNILDLLENYGEEKTIRLLISLSANKI